MQLSSRVATPSHCPSESSALPEAVLVRLELHGDEISAEIRSFFFMINDLSINPGHTESLNGVTSSAQQTAVPEPGRMVILGSGLLGGFRVMHRL